MSQPTKDYKVICISLYKKDIKDMDALVSELKKRGVANASRSALLRHALTLVDVGKVPHLDGPSKKWFSKR